ncbi:hypothetical protein GCM10023222_42850 [Saccharopolyspora cebuensis]
MRWSGARGRAAAGAESERQVGADVRARSIHEWWGVGLFLPGTVRAGADPRARMLRSTVPDRGRATNPRGVPARCSGSVAAG